MKRLAGCLASLILALVGAVVFIQPALAASGDVKVGVSQYNYTSQLEVWDAIPGGHVGQYADTWWICRSGYCGEGLYDTTPWLYPGGIRVDATGPYNTARSFRWKINGTGANGEWGTCHTANYDEIVPRSDQGYDWTVWVKNYRNSNCTNS